MTTPEFERLCRLWQRRLRLADWRISARIESEEEMPEIIGQIHPDVEEMTASMRVRADAPIEATLIHELLHLRLWPYSDGEPDEPNHEERERAINLLADCFLRAYGPNKAVKGKS